ncbi:MAG: tetratricopeptide repeat protein, partial [Candidatus Babeliales bacterium]
LNQYQDIIKFAGSLNAHFAKDPEIQRIFAISFEKMNNHAQADERFIRLNDQFKDHQEIALQTINVYLRKKEPENALKVIDHLLDSSPKKPNIFIFYFLKAQICMQLNKQEDARTHIKKSLEMHPQFDKGWLLFAILEEQAGKIDAAIKGYTTFLEVTTEPNKAIEQRLLALALKQKMEEKSKQPLLVNRSCFDKALLLFKQKQYTRALEQIDQCLKQSPDNNNNKLLKVQILSAQHNFKQAIRLLNKWIDLDPSNTLWHKVLHILPYAGAPARLVIQAFEQIKKRHPQQIWPSLYLADIHLQSQNNNTALACLQEVVTQVQDTLLKTKILFQISLLHYENEQFKQMRTVLEQIQQTTPDFAPQLNLLAYYYAMHDINSSKAQTLLDQALCKEPNNPHFLDTQAVIFYQQKKYTQAQKLLKQLVQKIPDDATILIHLAQVLYMLDNKDEALTTIQQAETKAKYQHEKKTINQLNKEWEKNKL